MHTLKIREEIVKISQQVQLSHNSAFRKKGISQQRVQKKKKSDNSAFRKKESHNRAFRKKGISQQRVQKKRNLTTAHSEKKESLAFQLL